MLDDLQGRASRESVPDFGILLMLAARAYADDLHRRLADLGFPGMRASFGFVLRQLRSAEPTQGELAVRLGVSKQAVGKVLDELEERGLVVRRADPSDRRARRVLMTDRGWAVSDAALRLSDEIEADLLARVGAERVIALRDALLVYVNAQNDGELLDHRTARPTW